MRSHIRHVPAHIAAGLANRRTLLRWDAPKSLGARADAVTLKVTLRVKIHNQNMTTAARAQADKKTFGHLS